MKTKIKIKLVDDNNNNLINTSFEINPFRKSSFNSPDNINGITDHNGEAIIQLDPSWYPYRLSYNQNSHLNGLIIQDFMVVESDNIVDWDLLKVDDFNLDPFTPAGTILRKAIQANVDANSILVTADEIKTNLANYSNQLYSDRLDNLVELLDSVTKLVSSLSEDKTHVLNALLQQQKQYEEIIDMHGDMALMAKDYLIAKSMGAIELNGHYLWFDSTNILRWKKGSPIDEFDGTAIN